MEYKDINIRRQRLQAEGFQIKDALVVDQTAFVPNGVPHFLEIGLTRTSINLVLLSHNDIGGMPEILVRTTGGHSALSFERFLVMLKEGREDE